MGSTAKKQCRGGGCDPIGLCIAGPVSGWLADRFSALAFAIGGVMLVATTFLSIGIFFSLTIAGLASTLQNALLSGLTAQD